MLEWLLNMPLELIGNSYFWTNALAFGQLKKFILRSLAGWKDIFWEAAN